MLAFEIILLTPTLLNKSPTMFNAIIRVDGVMVESVTFELSPKIIKTRN